jgi:hypothetical protein
MPRGRLPLAGAVAPRSFVGRPEKVSVVRPHADDAGGLVRALKPR